jgi:hypothetical protein
VGVADLVPEGRPAPRDLTISAHRIPLYFYRPCGPIFSRRIYERREVTANYLPGHTHPVTCGSFFDSGYDAFSPAF